MTDQIPPEKAAYDAAVSAAYEDGCRATARRLSTPQSTR
jgi:hypothetical protein